MTPSGVRKFGHKSMDDSGKHHPSDIGSGLETVDKQGGSPPKIPKDTTGGSASYPSGVKRGDGTESLKGTNRTRKRGSIPKAPGKGSSHIPGDVRKHSGLKAPKSGKQPK